MRRAAQLQQIALEKSRQRSEGVKDVAKVGAETGVGMIPAIGPIITATVSMIKRVQNRRNKIQSLEELSLIHISEPTRPY